MIKNYFKLIVALFYTFNSFGQSDWTTYNTSNSGIVGNTIGCMKIDSKDNIWCFTSGNNSTGVLTKFDGNNWTNYSNPPSLGPFTIDKEDNIWVGTDKLYKFDGINWTTFNPTIPFSQDGQITSIASDKQGNIWVGTFEDGLFKFDGINWIKQKEGGLYKTVNSIAFDSNDNIWITQLQVGVSKFDGTNWTTYPLPSSVNTPALSLFIDNKDNKWINAYVSVLKFDGINWTIYNSSNSDILKGTIEGFTTDTQNNLWVTFSGDKGKGGLSKFDGASWVNYTMDNSNIVSSEVRSIVIDFKGNKWFGTNNGLQKLTGDGISTLCNLTNAVIYKNKSRCKGNSFGILSSIEKKPTYTYTWKDANNNSLSTKNTDSIIVTSNGNYKFKVQDNVCFKSTELNIVIHDTFPESKQICMVTNQNGHNLVIWENADNNFISKYRISLVSTKK